MGGNERGGRSNVAENDGMTKFGCALGEGGGGSPEFAPVLSRIEGALGDVGSGTDVPELFDLFDVFDILLCFGPDPSVCDGLLVIVPFSPFSIGVGKSGSFEKSITSPRFAVSTLFRSWPDLIDAVLTLVRCF